MTLFWIAAGVLVATALLTLLPALLGRGRASRVARDALNLAVHRDRLAEIERQQADGELDPARAEEARLEVERDLLRDVTGGEAAGPAGRAAPRWVAGLVAVGVPLIAVLLYFETGAPQAIRQVAAVPPAHPGGQPGEHGAGQLEGLVEALAQRLRADPSNLQGWLMLGRSYATLQRYPESRDAFDAALRLAPQDPTVMTELAQATALASGGNLGGRAEELLGRALAASPDHPDALWLAGIAASQRGGYAEAAAHWEKLLRLVQSPEDRQTVEQYVAEARKQAGMEPAVPAAMPAAPPPAEGAPGSAGAGLVVNIALAAELRESVSPTDTVFIFARPAEGARMPLAIVRKTVAELPASVTLDDSMAMSPEYRLSGFPSVVVSARVSKTGSATPQSGDLEGVSAPLSPTSGGPVDLKIDHRI
jgi:cytochrome c-type biogenesis protein CcmH